MKRLVECLLLSLLLVFASCNDDVRLTSILAIGDNIQGEIEIFNDGKWRPMCSRSFSIDDAAVVCRTIGFHKGAAGRTENYLFEQVHKRNYYFLFDGLECKGSELHVVECPNWNKSVMHLNLCPQGIAIAQCKR